MQHSTQESITSQDRKRGERPRLVSELLTLREACRRFDLYPEKIYAWAEAGLLHPVKPNGRTLYPEWEIRALVLTPPYLRGLDLAEAA